MVRNLLPPKNSGRKIINNCAKLKGGVYSLEVGVTCDDIRLLQEKVRLVKLAKFPGAHGQVAMDIVSFVNEEILEMHSGLRSWISQTSTQLLWPGDGRVQLSHRVLLGAAIFPKSAWPRHRPRRICRM